jgi:hypothetical protein
LIKPRQKDVRHTPPRTNSYAEKSGEYLIA